MKILSKDFLLTFGPAILLVVVGFYIASKFVEPGPPKTVVISAGRNDGAYYAYAERYQAILARNKISLDIRTSDGSMENIRNLHEKKADIAFVQGGVGTEQDSQALRSLGSLFFEPIWIFHNSDRRDVLLTDFAGQRIAIGGAGSGTRAVAMDLLAENGIDGSEASMLTLGGMDSVDALLNEEIDVAVFIAAPSSSAVQKLLESEMIGLMDFRRADAYTRRHRYLSSVKLPEGVVDLKKNLPNSDVRLIAATANLVVREDLHPALIYLLLQASEEIHGKPRILESRGQFPSPDYLDFPISDIAARFYKSGTPFLQRFLPFWVAVYIDQMIVMLVPLVAVLLPLIKLTPPVYHWRVRSKIFRWYKALREVDRNLVLAKAGQYDINELGRELRRIEEEVERLEIPISFEDQHYNLRLHINLVESEISEIDKDQRKSVNAA